MMKIEFESKVPYWLQEGFDYEAMYQEAMYWARNDVEEWKESWNFDYYITDVSECWWYEIEHDIEVTWKITYQ